MAEQAPAATPQKGFLGMVERVGNKLPDPVFLFFYLILGIIAVSQICAWAGVSEQPFMSARLLPFEFATPSGG